MANKTYDFIIIGAGPAGCALASQLSRSKTAPSVLLLEAGGRNEHPHLRIDADRYSIRLVPGMDWGYKTEPQASLDGRAVKYDRGRGLGGSSATNFCAWNVGPRDDFEELVRATGDPMWAWENCRALLDELEDYRAAPDSTVEGLQRWLDLDAEKHGSGGPLKIGFPSVWEKSVLDMVDVWAENGVEINKDLGTGDNLGIGIVPNTAFQGYRTTAADLLSDPPQNLEVVTDVHVHKVQFEGKKAVGVVTTEGTTYSASKEIIVSGGSLSTPKILMHSGIGPKDQLSNFSIPIVHENPNVGQNLIDHCHVAPTWQRKDASPRSTFLKNPHLREAALQQWERDRTGPLSELMCMNGMGFMKSDAVLASAEFDALPDHRKQHLRAATVPSYEVIVGVASAEYFVDPLNTPPVESVYVFLMNGESRGQVSLQSADPTEPLLFDPKMLSHPYDKRVAVESVREMLNIAESPAFRRDIVKMLHGPKSDSEEDILSYWREEVASTWHMSGTCKMGKGQVEDDAVVDSDFKVFGVDGLRVADMSVLPIIVNNHTQTTAYLTGMLAAEKISNEHSLNA